MSVWGPKYMRHRKESAKNENSSDRRWAILYICISNYPKMGHWLSWVTKTAPLGLATKPSRSKLHVHKKVVTSNVFNI